MHTQLFRGGLLLGFSSVQVTDNLLIPPDRICKSSMVTMRFRYDGHHAQRSGMFIRNSSFCFSSILEQCDGLF